jgi:tetratricopeptide (TPR) repeat protein
MFYNSGMNEEELFDLLNDETKKVANWDSVITYFAKRFNDNDLNGLYGLVALALSKAEKSNEFELADYIYFDFFLAAILEHELVGWRARKHLDEANSRLEKIDFYSLLDIDKEELAKFYFDLGTHYEKISLIKKAIEAYQNSTNIYYELKHVDEAEFIDSKIIDLNYRLPTDERHFLSTADIKNKYGDNSYLIELLNEDRHPKYNLIEQSKPYLDVINGINEELIRKGIFSSHKDYKKYKKELLRAKGINWD